MNVTITGKSIKYSISNYYQFAEKFLKPKVKALWDQQRTYTKAERDAALRYLAEALDIDANTRLMLTFVLRFKRQHEKKLRTYVQSCIQKKIPPELTMYHSKMPSWMKLVEAKLHTLPKLIEACRISGLLPVNKTTALWATIVQALVAESHMHQRVPTIEDVKVVAANIGFRNYQLLFRLWIRQKNSATYKFGVVHEAGDVAREMALALTPVEWRVVDIAMLYAKDLPLVSLNEKDVAREMALALTPVEWRVVDIALLYVKDLPLVSLNNKIQPLMMLYHLIMSHKIEEHDGGDPRDKWAGLLHEYALKYLTSPSGLVLQRQWWELKKLVHDNIRERLRTVGYKVHPLLVEIAAKYPCIAREPPGEWLDMVKNGKVYDVSNVECADAMEESDKSDEDDLLVVRPGFAPEADKETKSKDSVIDLDSEGHSDEDISLVIDESTEKKSPSKFIISDLYLKDEENPEQKDKDPDNVPVTPKKDQTHDLNETNNHINITSVEERRNSEINSLNDELNLQLNLINDNDSSGENISKCNDGSLKNTSENNTENVVEIDCDNNDNMTITIDDNSSDNVSNTDNINDNEISGINVTKTSDSFPKEKENQNTAFVIEVAGTNQTDSIIVTYDNSPVTDYINTIDNIVAGGSTIKEYSETEPLQKLQEKAKESVFKTYSKVGNERDIEIALKRLDLEFQKQMRYMMSLGNERKKPNIKKVEDKIVPNTPKNVESSKATKSNSSNKVDKPVVTKKKNDKVKTKLATKKSKVNPVSTEVYSDSKVYPDSNIMDPDEGNLAAKSLIESSEIPNDTTKSVIATVYACKAPDGTDLGHVILPAPITKENVTVSIKTDSGSISIDSAVVNDPKTPLKEPLKHEDSSLPLNNTAQHLPESKQTLNESKESDIDLLQKIDPAQAKSVIIFSDSEDEGEIKSLGDTNQEKIPKKIEGNIPNVAGKKQDYINLNDVKKFLNNHSLDDILTKMGDIAVKKEAKLPEKESDNRGFESLICVSDSDDDDAQKKTTAENNDVFKSDNKETEVKKDPEQVTKLVGCRSNEYTMINSGTYVIDETPAMENSSTGAVNTDVLNVQDAQVLIIPNFFNTSNSLAPATTNVLLPTVLPLVRDPPPLQPISNPRTKVPTSTEPSPSSNIVTPKSTISPSPKVSNPISNIDTPSLTVLSSATNVAKPTRNESPIPAPTPIMAPTPPTTTPTPPKTTPTPPIESPTSNVKIATPNSNVVTMVINDMIASTFKNISDDVMSADTTVNKSNNQKTYKNKMSDKKPRRTKTYGEAGGYSGLFQLKDRSTKETVGMLCRIKEEKSLVSEVTQKIDNYLDKFKDVENDQPQSENRSDVYNIISKKLEIENKKRSSDGFLKMMLDNCKAKTLWTGENKDNAGKETTDDDKTDEGNSNDGSFNGESSTQAIDPKLIMDTRIYLPKLDEVENYNRNRRVDFSINTKRISRQGYKILNYKMKSDGPALIADNTKPNSPAPIAEHIESEIAEAIKKRIPEEMLKKMIVEETAKQKSRKKPEKSRLIHDVRKKLLDNLMKQVKKERELQQSLIPDDDGRTAIEKRQSVTDTINRLAEKIIKERQKQQSLNENTSNIVQRIKFENEDEFNSNDANISSNSLKNSEENINDNKNITKEDSELQSVLKDTRQSFNDNNDDVNDDDTNRDDLFNSGSDMELDTTVDNNLILDSSINKQDLFDTISENRDKNPKSTTKDDDKNIISNDNDINMLERIAVSVKVEPIDTETHKTANDSSDDEIIHRPKKIKRVISSDENDDESWSESDEEPVFGLRRPRKLKKKLNTSGNDDRWSKSDDESVLESGDRKKRRNVRRTQITSDDEELGMRLENELLKEDSAEEDDVEGGLLKEIRSSGDVPVKKSNIEEMLKLCKPVRLCLERVKVPKDTDSQVRKVELPDRTSLKRHRAPTAHVAPIQAAELQQTDGENKEDNEASNLQNAAPESSAGGAREIEIGNLLEQLSKETKDEWQRLEESVKRKRPRMISEAEHSYAKKAELTSDKKTDKNRRKREDKKKPSQEERKDSSDEVDPSLEWQRQKNINYNFFNFNPVSKSLDSDPTNIRSMKYHKPNRKHGILVRKVVVDDARMHKDDEIIDLDDINDDNNDKPEQSNDKTVQNDTIEAMLDEINRNVSKNFAETTPITPKGSQFKMKKSDKITLTPIFTKIDPKFVESNEGFRPKETESFNSLIPIATKIEKPKPKEPEKEEPKKPAIVKKYYAMKYKNFVQSYKEQYNSNASTSQDVQPSTSKETDIVEPIPSTSKGPNLICISDDSSDVFELTQTISVKNNDNNKEPPKTDVRNSTIDSAVVTVSPIKSILKGPNPPKNDIVPTAHVLNPPVKVFQSLKQVSRVVSPSVKIMDIGPIKSNEPESNDQNNTETLLITNVTSIPSTIDLDNDSNDGLKIDESANAEQDTSMPRIKNVMSIQTAKTVKNHPKKVLNQGTVPQIQNVRSIRSKSNDDEINVTLLTEPVNSNDEYDSDSDKLRIDEHFDEDLDNTPKLALFEDLCPTDIKTTKVINQKAKENVITVLKLDYGKGNPATPNYQSLIKNVQSNIKKNVRSLLKPLNDIHSENEKEEKDINNQENIPTLSNKEMPENSDNKNECIDNKIEVSNTNISSKDGEIDENNKNNIGNNNSIANDNKMEVDIPDKSKVDKNESFNIYAEENLPVSPTKDLEDSNMNENLDNSTEDDSTVIIPKAADAIDKTEETQPKENETANPENTVKPKTFLKVVPIQRLRGEPITTDNKDSEVEMGEAQTSKDIKVRGQPIPFQCLSMSDEESTKSDTEMCGGGSLPVISSVMSLSSNAGVSDQPSTSLTVNISTSRPIKISKTNVIVQSNVWNPSKADTPTTTVVKRLEFSKLTSLPPVPVTNFIKDRDCTNISLLCIDEWRPLWLIHGEYLILTNLKLPVIGATYWMIGPRAQFTRLLIDNKESEGSTIVGACSVPDEVFLDNNWYKKLSTEPMIYAKIWFVVPDQKTCTEMINSRIQMQLCSRLTGVIQPLTIKTLETQYRINSNNLNVKIPETATVINNSLKTGKPTQLVVDGQFAPKDMFKPVSKAKPVNDEVISLDSDDE